MKLYVDDKRPCPEGWTPATSLRMAFDVIGEYGDDITHIAFDGYLSDEMQSHTGYALIRGLKYEGFDFKKNPRENYTTHSADEYLNVKMNNLLDQIFGLKEDVKEDVKEAEPFPFKPMKSKPVKKKRLFRV